VESQSLVAKVQNQQYCGLGFFLASHHSMLMEMFRPGMSSKAELGNFPGSSFQNGGILSNGIFWSGIAKGRAIMENPVA
jgi:hypothetical protein